MLLSTGSVIFVNLFFLVKGQFFWSKVKRQGHKGMFETTTGNRNKTLRKIPPSFCRITWPSEMANTLTRPDYWVTLGHDFNVEVRLLIRFWPFINRGRHNLPSSHWIGARRLPYPRGYACYFTRGARRAVGQQMVRVFVIVSAF